MLHLSQRFMTPEDGVDNLARFQYFKLAHARTISADIGFTPVVSARHRHVSPIRPHRPADRPVVVLFVVGGLAPLELAEVNRVVRCCAEAEVGQGGEAPEVIVGGTTICTPSMVYEHVFLRPPARP